MSKKSGLVCASGEIKGVNGRKKREREREREREQLYGTHGSLSHLDSPLAALVLRYHPLG